MFFEGVFRLNNKKTRKMIVYLMIIAMVASTLLAGLSFLF